MIALGIWHLRNEARGWGVRFDLAHWGGMIAGGLVVVVSFTLDYRNIMSGGMPHRFAWGIFGLGMMIGISSYAGAAYRQRPRTFTSVS